MKVGAALTGALLATLATPATWPLGLATFLLRGGLLLVVLPIVVLPSPVGLGNLLAPVLMSVVFRGVSFEVAVIVAVVALAFAGWVVVGGLVSASLEAESARIVARDEEGSGASGRAIGTSAATPDRRIVSRIFAARVIGHVPSSFAILWGSARLIEVAYHELTSPLDVRTPIPLRILAGAPEVIVVLLIVWSLGEIVGGIAARRIALDGASAPGALRDAIGATIRHPVAVGVGFWIPTAGLLLVVLSSALAAMVAWSAVRVAMRPSGDLLLGTLAVILFVSLWLVGLLLIAVTAAWRAAVWSVAHRELWPVHVSRARADPV